MRDRLGAKGAVAVAAALVLVTGVLAALTWGGNDDGSVAADGTATTTTERSTTTTAPTTTSIPFTEVTDDRPAAFVWSPGGIAEDLVAKAADLGDIDPESTSLIDGDRIMFVATADSSGTEVDRATGDLAYPLDLFSVDTDTIRPFVSVGMQRALHELGDDEAIIGSSSSRLRRIKTGGTIELRDGTILTVAAVVPDQDVAGAEAVVAKPTGERIGATTPRYILVKFDDDLSPVQQAFRDAHPAESPIRIASASDARFARSGDGVLTQVEIKLTFGEFGFVEGDGVRDFAERDPAFIDANIGSATLPVIGRIECHRELLGSLRAALTDVDELQRGLQADYLASLPPTTTTTTTATTTTAPPVGPDGSTSTTASTAAPQTSTTTTTEPPPPEADPDYPVLLEADASLGCFNPRQIGQGGPENGVSRHAWGAAIDLRPPRGAARHDSRVVAIFARWGFLNGQDWLNADAPHFEWNVPPDAPDA